MAAINRPEEAEQELIFESEDSYAFVKAAEALKQAGLPIACAEEYTGEFRPSRRAPPPYIWRIYVAKCDGEAAVSILSGSQLMPVVHDVTVPVPEEPSAAVRFASGLVLAAFVIITVYWLYTLLTQ